MSVPIEVPAAESDHDDPVTLHRIMQNMIGDRLKARYQPPKNLSHELFVLMLQLKERERRPKAVKPRTRTVKPQKALAASL